MPEYLTEHATPDDAAAIRDIVFASVPVMYRGLIEPFLSGTTADDERILVSRDRPSGAVTGFVLFGIVPGTLGAGRIRGIAVAPMARRRGVGRSLLEAAVRSLQTSHARLVLLELPDEPAVRFVAALVEACAFTEESRAADLVRDGVAMRYLRRDLPRA